MHQGKSCVIVWGGMQCAGEDIRIDLGPAQTEHAADHAHEPVFDVGQLRRLLGALSVDHDQGVLIGGECAVVVVASEHGIGEALTGGAGTTSHQCVGHGAVKVVNDAYRRGCRRRLNVGRHGDGAISIHDHVGAAYIFRKLAAMICYYRCCRDGSPWAKSVSYEGIGGSIRQNRTEIALIGVISNQSLGPN